MNSNTLRCQIYKNGALFGSSTNYQATDIPAGFSSTTIFGTNFLGKLADVRVYATDLSNDDIQELYQTRAQFDNKGNIHVPELIETKHEPLTLDYTV